MSKNGIRYSEEFKQQLVDLYNLRSSVSHRSREYSITNVMNYKRIKELSPIKISDKQEMTSKEYEATKKRIAELVVKAVKNAYLNVKATEDIILHSDLGSQYTSQKFEDYLSTKQMIHSFSRKGNPYDSACIESFHSVLKKEEVNHHKYYDIKAARKAVFKYI